MAAKSIFGLRRRSILVTFFVKKLGRIDGPKLIFGLGRRSILLTFL